MTDEYSTLPDSEIVVYEGTDTGVAVDVHLDREKVGSVQLPMRQGFRTPTAIPIFISITGSCHDRCIVDQT